MLTQRFSQSRSQWPGVLVGLPVPCPSLPGVKSSRRWGHKTASTTSQLPGCLSVAMVLAQSKVHPPATSHSTWSSECHLAAQFPVSEKQGSQLMNNALSELSWSSAIEHAKWKVLWLSPTKHSDTLAFHCMQATAADVHLETRSRIPSTETIH